MLFQKKKKFKIYSALYETFARFYNSIIKATYILVQFELKYKKTQIRLPMGRKGNMSVQLGMFFNQLEDFFTLSETRKPFPSLSFSQAYKVQPTLELSNSNTNSIIENSLGNPPTSTQSSIMNKFSHFTTKFNFRLDIQFDGNDDPFIKFSALDRSWHFIKAMHGRWLQPRPLCRGWI